MGKAGIIQLLAESKKAHLDWVTRAHALVEGLVPEDDRVPIHGTECKFGLWYYGQGQVLSHIPAFIKIEAPHLQLHDVYLQIFKLMKVRDETIKLSVFDKIMGKEKTVTLNRQEADHKAHALFTELKKISKTITTHVDELKSTLVDMSDEAMRSMLQAQGLNIDPSKNVIALQKTR